MTRKQARRENKTILLVGEGEAEVSLLKHFKSLYLVRNSGISVQIKNAYGGGASSVIRFASRQAQNFDFTLKVALLDADKDWSVTTKEMARLAQVEVLLCEPCLEGFLLDLHRACIHGRTTERLKRDFAERFRSNAHDADVYPAHFSKALLDATQGNQIVGRLIDLFSNSKA